MSIAHRRPSGLVSVFALAALLAATSVACGGASHGAAASSGPGGSRSSASSSTGTSAGGGGGGATTASSSSSASTSSGATTTSSTSSSSSGSSSSGSVWHPTAAAPIHFHWMIGGFTPADILPNQNGPAVYDIDGEGATASDVAAIHAAGAIAVCYVDVGALEKGRSDYADFPASVIGPVVNGWPQENWLLVTAANQSTILALMQKRFESWCKAKGFDAIEPDNLDAWTNISNVSQADNLAYDLAIAKLSHMLPLSIGLKNLAVDLDPSQYATFVSAFDWALNEQCYEYQECGVYTAAQSFIPANKAVFDVEYNVNPDCAQADQAHMNAQRTDLALVGAKQSGYSYAPCVPDAQATW